MLYTVVDTEKENPRVFWDGHSRWWIDDAFDLSGCGYKSANITCKVLNRSFKSMTRYIVMTVEDAKEYQNLIEL